ncbi:MAG: hypothetical protein K5866_04165 [Treponema sp.]|nr:hypothetical protein [Treponema sp.]
MRKSVSSFFIIFLTLIFLSCDNAFIYWIHNGGDEEYHINFDLTAYNEAKEKWENLNCKNYSYTYMIFADRGPSPLVKVSVADGECSYQILEGSYENDSSDQESLEDKKELDESEKFFTAESLFVKIWEAYEAALKLEENPPEGLISKNIVVTYDDESGIPVSIDLSGSWDQPVCGDWWGLEVEEINIPNK